MEQWLLHWRDIFVGLFVGFAGAYLVAKAKNRAMREDIAKLTRITEDIKAEVSKEHREWEFKKEIMRDTARILGLLKESAVSLAAAYSTSANNAATEKFRREKLEAAYDRHWSAQADFAVVMMLISVSFGDAVNEEAQKVEIVMEAVTSFTTHSTPEEFDEKFSEVSKQIRALLAAIRSELVTI